MSWTKRAIFRKMKGGMLVNVFLCLLCFSTTYADHIVVGDLDGDGDVDFQDFLIFSQNFGKSPAQLKRMPHASTDTIRVVVRDTIEIEKVVTVRMPPEPLPKPEIIVNPGGWGNTTITVLQDVFESTRDALADQLMYPLDSNITVIHKEPEGPKILYNRRPNGNYEMWIDSEDTYWAQQIFQFAHEHGHIITNYREDFPNPQTWFEESISMVASIYALETLSHRWAQNPPRGQPGYKNFASYLPVYVDGMGDYFGVSREYIRNLNLREWYQNNRYELENDLGGVNTRQHQYIVATKIVDIFKRHPEAAWNATRYMNKGHVRVNSDFTEYLNAWRKYTPARWQFVVDEVMARFGIRRLNKPIIPVITTRTEHVGPLGKKGKHED